MVKTILLRSSHICQEKYICVFLFYFFNLSEVQQRKTVLRWPLSFSPLFKSKSQDKIIKKYWMKWIKTTKIYTMQCLCLSLPSAGGALTTILTMPLFTFLQYYTAPHTLIDYPQTREHSPGSRCRSYLRLECLKDD